MRDMFKPGKFVFFVFVSIGFFVHVSGNAALIRPTARGMMWIKGTNSPTNYNYMGLNCGGLKTIRRHNGQCGLCGDPYGGSRDHEFGGKYTTSAISRTYGRGQKKIEVKVLVNTFNKGHFEFRLCSEGPEKLTQQCFDQHKLKIKQGRKQGDENVFSLTRAGLITLQLEIPENLSCEKCVLQWKYITGNSWGRDENGRPCMGCGHQEMFINCADIRIDGWSSSPDPPPIAKATDFSSQFPSDTSSQDDSSSQSETQTIPPPPPEQSSNTSYEINNEYQQPSIPPPPPHQHVVDRNQEERAKSIPKPPRGRNNDSSYKHVHTAESHSANGNGNGDSSGTIYTYSHSHDGQPLHEHAHPSSRPKNSQFDVVETSSMLTDKPTFSKENMAIDSSRPGFVNDRSVSKVKRPHHQFLERASNLVRTTKSVRFSDVRFSDIPHSPIEYNVKTTSNGKKLHISSLEQEMSPIHVQTIDKDSNGNQSHTRQLPAPRKTKSNATSAQSFQHMTKTATSSVKDAAVALDQKHNSEDITAITGKTSLSDAAGRVNVSPSTSAVDSSQLLNRIDQSKNVGSRKDTKEKIHTLPNDNGDEAAKTHENVSTIASKPNAVAAGSIYVLDKLKLTNANQETSTEPNPPTLSASDCSALFALLDSTFSKMTGFPTLPDLSQTSKLSATDRAALFLEMNVMDSLAERSDILQSSTITEKQNTGITSLSTSANKQDSHAQTLTALQIDQAPTDRHTQTNHTHTTTSEGPHNSTFDASNTHIPVAHQTVFAPKYDFMSNESQQNVGQVGEIHRTDTQPELPVLLKTMKSEQPSGILNSFPAEPAIETSNIDNSGVKKLLSGSEKTSETINVENIHQGSLKNRSITVDPKIESPSPIMQHFSNQEIKSDGTYVHKNVQETPFDIAIDRFEKQNSPKNTPISKSLESKAIEGHNHHNINETMSGWGTPLSTSEVLAKAGTIDNLLKAQEMVNYAHDHVMPEENVEVVTKVPTASNESTIIQTNDKTKHKATARNNVKTHFTEAQRMVDYLHDHVHQPAIARGETSREFNAMPARTGVEMNKLTVKIKPLSGTENIANTDRLLQKDEHNINSKADANSGTVNVKLKLYKDLKSTEQNTPYKADQPFGTGTVSSSLDDTGKITKDNRGTFRRKVKSSTMNVRDNLNVKEAAVSAAKNNKNLNEKKNDSRQQAFTLLPTLKPSLNKPFEKRQGIDHSKRMSGAEVNNDRQRNISVPTKDAMHENIPPYDHHHSQDHDKMNRDKVRNRASSQILKTTLTHQHHQKGNIADIPPVDSFDWIATKMKDKSRNLIDQSNAGPDLNALTQDKADGKHLGLSNENDKIVAAAHQESTRKHLSGSGKREHVRPNVDRMLQDREQQLKGAIQNRMLSQRQTFATGNNEHLHQAHKISHDSQSQFSTTQRAVSRHAKEHVSSTQPKDKHMMTQSEILSSNNPLVEKIIKPDTSVLHDNVETQAANKNGLLDNKSIGPSIFDTSNEIKQATLPVHNVHSVHDATRMAGLKEHLDHHASDILQPIHRAVQDVNNPLHLIREHGLHLQDHPGDLNNPNTTGTQTDKQPFYNVGSESNGLTHEQSVKHHVQNIKNLYEPTVIHNRPSLQDSDPQPGIVANSIPKPKMISNKDIHQHTQQLNTQQKPIMHELHKQNNGGMSAFKHHVDTHGSDNSDSKQSVIKDVTKQSKDVEVQVKKANKFQTSDIIGKSMPEHNLQGIDHVQSTKHQEIVPSESSKQSHKHEHKLHEIQPPRLKNLQKQNEQSHRHDHTAVISRKGGLISEIKNQHDLVMHKHSVPKTQGLGGADTLSQEISLQANRIEHQPTRHGNTILDSPVIGHEVHAHGHTVQEIKPPPVVNKHTDNLPQPSLPQQKRRTSDLNAGLHQHGHPTVDAHVPQPHRARQDKADMHHGSAHTDTIHSQHQHHLPHKSPSISHTHLHPIRTKFRHENFDPIRHSGNHPQSEILKATSRHNHDVHKGSHLTSTDTKLEQFNPLLHSGDHPQSVVAKAESGQSTDVRRHSHHSIPKSDLDMADTMQHSGPRPHSDHSHNMDMHSHMHHAPKSFHGSSDSVGTSDSHPQHLSHHSTGHGEHNTPPKQPRRKIDPIRHSGDHPQSALAKLRRTEWNNNLSKGRDHTLHNILAHAGHSDHGPLQTPQHSHLDAHGHVGFDSLHLKPQDNVHTTHQGSHDLVPTEKGRISELPTMEQKANKHANTLLPNDHVLSNISPLSHSHPLSSHGHISTLQDHTISAHSHSTLPGVHPSMAHDHPPLPIQDQVQFTNDHALMPHDHAPLHQIEVTTAPQTRDTHWTKSMGRTTIDDFVHRLTNKMESQANKTLSNGHDTHIKVLPLSKETIIQVLQAIANGGKPLTTVLTSHTDQPKTAPKLAANADSDSKLQNSVTGQPMSAEDIAPSVKLHDSAHSGQTVSAKKGAELNNIDLGNVQKLTTTDNGNSNGDPFDANRKSDTIVNRIPVTNTIDLTSVVSNHRAERRKQFRSHNLNEVPDLHPRKRLSNKDKETADLIALKPHNQALPVERTSHTIEGPSSTKKDQESRIPSTASNNSLRKRIASLWRKPSDVKSPKRSFMPHSEQSVKRNGVQGGDKPPIQATEPRLLTPAEHSQPLISHRSRTPQRQRTRPNSRSRFEHDTARLDNRRQNTQLDMQRKPLPSRRQSARSHSNTMAQATSRHPHQWTNGGVTLRGFRGTPFSPRQPFIDSRLPNEEGRRNSQRQMPNRSPSNVRQRIFARQNGRLNDRQRILRQPGDQMVRGPQIVNTGSMNIRSRGGTRLSTSGSSRQRTNSRLRSSSVSSSRRQRLNTSPTRDNRKLSSRVRLDRPFSMRNNIPRRGLDMITRIEPQKIRDMNGRVMFVGSPEGAQRVISDSELGNGKNALRTMRRIITQSEQSSAARGDPRRRIVVVPLNRKTVSRIFGDIGPRRQK